MKLKTLLVFICILASPFANAQFTPYFENYSLSKYNASNQNWGISKGDDGKIYVANNNGLLIYNGLNWKIKSLPNKTTIRSVLAVKDKIYTGSYEEFGYWTYNDKGQIIYHSLSHLLNKTKSTSEEFWQILDYNDKIVFRSFQNIYVYENDKITKINLPSTVISCSIVNNTLYVSTLNKGVFILNNQLKLTPFIQDDIIAGDRIISISNYKNQLLLTTDLKGCFIIKNKKLEPLNLPINETLKKYQLNRFGQLDNGYLVFGTIKNGLYITNHNGEVVYNINKENGLANNTVLSILIEKNENIWLCLDNGLSKINLKNNISYYNDVTGKLGAVYDVINFNNTIYIGSNTGLYYLDQDHNLKFIEGTQGQVWDLKIIDGQLFCGHNNGTYLVTKDKIELISNFTGGWTLKKIPDTDIYTQGTYGGLVKFKKENNKWQVNHLGKTTNPIRFLEYENKQQAWAANAYKGLSKVVFNTNHDSITKVVDYNHKGLETDYNVRVYKLKNTICFKTNNGWKKYEPLLDSIVPYPFLNEKIGKNSDVISEASTNSIFFKNNNGIIKLDEDNSVKEILTRNYYDNRIILGYENVSKLNDSTYTLNLNDGFLMFNPNHNFSAQSPKTPAIEQIKVNDTYVSLDNKVIDIPNNGNINITISSPGSTSHSFEYSLTTDPNKWEKVDNENLVLSNLKNGDFGVLFRTTNKSGQTSDVKSLKLHVLPPWYKSSLGFILYFIAALILTAIFYFLHKRKMYKEQRRLEIELKKEQQHLLREKNIENERKLVEIKNEALESEIQLKSKQLANTAIALVKKNEALLEIKKDLQINEGQFSNKLINRRIQKKIDQTIGNKDQWEIFEYNFNQVHKKFFNQLKEKHPKLSPKDLKLSAYIKMNLTTKEIAPLMNISTRGVETHRYRLKRKLKLDKEDSLTEYLHSFN